MYCKVECQKDPHFNHDFMAMFSLLSDHVTFSFSSLVFLYFCNGKAIESARRKNLPRFCGRKQIAFIIRCLMYATISLSVFSTESSDVWHVHADQEHSFI